MWKDKDVPARDLPPNEAFRGNIGSYRDAVEEFSSSAAEFLKCLPTLTSTRSAYERAMSISSEVRKTLDAGDETLRRMMAQIEDAVHAQLSKTPEKKRPEVVKMEPVKSEEKENASKVLPSA